MVRGPGNTADGEYVLQVAGDSGEPILTRGKPKYVSVDNKHLSLEVAYNDKWMIRLAREGYTEELVFPRKPIDSDNGVVLFYCDAKEALPPEGKGMWQRFNPWTGKNPGVAKDVSVRGN